MKFQSVGSQYDFQAAWSHLWARGSKSSDQALTSELVRQFGGSAYLYANGRSALAAALKAVINPSDAVAINGFTCYVVQEAVKTAGAEPVFLDVDMSTLNFSEIQLEESYKSYPNIRVVVVQNTFGIACDIARIEAFARAHDMVIVEDLAHSVGMTYPDGRKAGTVGDFVMLSFGRDKLLDCVSGGALIIRNPQYFEKIQSPAHAPSRAVQRRDRWYPILMWKARKLYPISVGKLLMRFYRTTGMVVRTADGSIDPLCKLPSWQASLVLSKLGALDADITRRKQLVTTYSSQLPGSSRSSGAPIRFPFLAKNRAKVFDALRKHHYYLDDTWYDTPIGPARLYAKVNYHEEECPNAVAVAQRIINLPTHRHISEADAAHISQIVQEVERESV